MAHYPQDRKNSDRTDEYHVKGRERLAESTSDEKFDSPLTYHGKPRKRAYKKNRADRKFEHHDLGRVSVKKMMERVKDAQLMLLTYAPMYTNIYTFVYGLTLASRNFYVDIFSVHDNRLYKLTRIVSRILRLKVIEKHSMQGMRYALSVPKSYMSEEDLVGTDYDIHKRIQEKIIKHLSTTMFGNDAGYFWQSLDDLYPYDTAKPIIKKDFIVPKTEPVKDYRIRPQIK